MIDPDKARAVFGTARTWHVNDGDFPGLLARLEQDAITVDLNDPATENLVADAIRRLAPADANVPLSVRYPWRFTDFTRTGQRMSLTEAVVAPLLALADAIDRGDVLSGPAPGPCPAQSPEVPFRGGFRYACELRATHAGLHEATVYSEDIGTPDGKVRWHDQTDGYHRKLDKVIEHARHQQVAETARAVLEYLQPVLPEQWAREAAAAFGVADLYVADPSPRRGEDTAP